MLKPSEEAARFVQRYLQDNPRPSGLDNLGSYLGRMAMHSYDGGRFIERRRWERKLISLRVLWFIAGAATAFGWRFL